MVVLARRGRPGAIGKAGSTSATTCLDASSMQISGRFASYGSA
jgi:hypothetical protein